MRVRGGQARHRKEHGGDQAGLDQAAYRIIQESLTNTVKHAHASRATVALNWETTAIVLRVTDDGRSPGHGANGDGHGGNGTAHGGHGLAGMRERAVLYGGTLEAGPQPGGGFAVLARLPL